VAGAFATQGGGTGRYRLFAEIASGTVASVHLGLLVNSAGFVRTVAVKRMYPQFAKDPEFVAMFLDEVRLVGRIKHPNVVPTLDIIRQDDQLLLIMEYVAGEALSHLVKAVSAQGERIDPRIACALIVGVLHGLHAAHEAKNEFGEPLGIVHRDVSPQNVLVGVDGVARVVDFGIAKAIGRWRDPTRRENKGKLAYMAPEQIRGAAVTRAADVWAASVVLWELLAGKPLFTGEDDALVQRRVLSAEIPDISQVAPGVPHALEGILRKGICRDPGQRFQTARAMATAIEQAVSLALSSEVGGWVERACGGVIAQRAERIRQVETSSRNPPGTELVPSAEFIADALSWNVSKPEAESSAEPTRPKPAVAFGPSVRPARTSRPLDVSEVAEVAVMRRPTPISSPRTGSGRWLWACGALAFGAFALALGSLFVPSYAKREAIEAAAARGVSLDIEEANGGYSAIHFRHVRAVLPDVPGAVVTMSDVDVELAWLRPQRARALGVDVLLDGPIAKTFDLVTLWYRGHQTGRDAGNVPDGLQVEVPAARLAWSHAFGNDGRIEAESISGELAPKGSARLGDELHFTTSKLTMTSKAVVIGPWRLDVEGDPGATTIRVGFDPPVPDGPNAILSRIAAGKTELDVNIPRSPLLRLGIPPLALSGFKQVPEQAEMRLHSVRGADNRVDATLTAAFFGVKAPSVAVPLDIHVSGSVAGSATAPLELQGGVLTVGPIRATLSGPVSLRPDGDVGANLAWKTTPMPCAQFLPRGQRAANDLAAQLGALSAGSGDLASLGLDVTALAQVAGIAKVEGNLSASGTVVFDSGDPTNTTFTMAAKNSCGIAFFGPH
jgi:eukaryotic-like serine/threonine-protein kinase